MKNLLLKSTQCVAMGMMMGSLLTAPSWAMDNMPDEILEHTFSCLPLKTLLKAAFVCKKWDIFSKHKSLWKRHGSSSKQELLGDFYPILKQEDLEVLFKTGSVRGNEPLFWKLEGNVEHPSEIISSIASNIYPVPRWFKDETIPILCTKKEGNVMDYTTELPFLGDTLFPWLFYEKVPYVLTLTGSGSIENAIGEN